MVYAHLFVLFCFATNTSVALYVKAWASGLYTAGYYTVYLLDIKLLAG